MPILLTTPHTYSPGHGEADQVYPFVEIERFKIDPLDDDCIIVMRYIDVDGEGAITRSPEAGRKFRLQNIPPQTAGGLDSEGMWQIQEVAPANPVYDDFIAGSLTSASSVLLIEEVQNAIYDWLIAEGYYTGTKIV